MKTSAFNMKQKYIRHFVNLFLLILWNFQTILSSCNNSCDGFSNIGEENVGGLPTNTYHEMQNLKKEIDKYKAMNSIGYKLRIHQNINEKETFEFENNMQPKNKCIHMKNSK